jgi:hypothetical protein
MPLEFLKSKTGRTLIESHRRKKVTVTFAQRVIVTSRLLEDSFGREVVICLHIH